MTGELNRRDFFRAGAALAAGLATVPDRSRAQGPEIAEPRPMTREEIMEVLRNFCRSTKKPVEIKAAENITADLHELMAAFIELKTAPERFNRLGLWEILKRHLPHLGDYSDKEMVRVALDELPAYLADRGIIAKTHLSSLALASDDRKVVTFFPQIDFFKVTSVTSSPLEFEGQGVDSRAARVEEYKFAGQSRLTAPLTDSAGLDITPAEDYHQNILVHEFAPLFVEKVKAMEAEEAKGMEATDRQMHSGISALDGESQTQASLIAARVRLQRQMSGDRLEYIIAHEKGHVLDSHQRLNDPRAIESEAEAQYRIQMAEQRSDFSPTEAHGEIWGALGSMLFHPNKADSLYEFTRNAAQERDPGNEHQRAYEFVLYSIIKEILDFPGVYGVVIEDSLPLSPANQVLWQLPDLCARSVLVNEIARKLWHKFSDPAYTEKLMDELGRPQVMPVLRETRRATVSREPVSTSPTDEGVKGGSWRLAAALGVLGAGALAAYASRRKIVAEAEARQRTEAEQRRQQKRGAKKRGRR